MLIGQNVKNYLINSQFDIWQRRASGTLGAGSSAWGFFADRGYAATAAGGGTTSAITVSRVAYPGSDNNQRYIWRASNASLGSSLGAASYHVIYSQRIEDVRTLASKSVTVSIWATTNIPNKMLAVSIEQQFGSGGSSTTFQGANITLTGGSTLTRYDVSINLPSISGKLVGSGSDHAVGVYIYSQMGSSVAASLGVTPFDLQGTGNIDIYRVMINEGSPADFELAGGGNPGVELALCQRYYEILPPWRDTRNTVSTGNAYPFNTQLQFKVEKRATPAMSWVMGATSFSAFNFSDISTRGAVFGVSTGATGFSASSYAYVDSFTADAEL